MNKQRLYVDMDGTLAVFRQVDTLETLYEPGYFFGLEPHENVVEAIRALIADGEKEGIEVFILSAYLTDSKFALEEKGKWLDRYLPEIDDAHRVFVPCGTDKKAAVDIREDDFLLDDYTKNLKDWEPPAKGIKLVNAINDTHKTWHRGRVWYDQPPDEIEGDIIYLMKDKIYRMDEAQRAKESGFLNMSVREQLKYISEENYPAQSQKTISKTVEKKF